MAKIIISASNRLAHKEKIHTMQPMLHYFFVILQPETQSAGLSPLPQRAKEESPGSTEHSTS